MRLRMMLCFAGTLSTMLTAAAIAQEKNTDLSKGRAERPLERVLENGENTAGRTAAAEASGGAFDNPRVPAGKVRWHADFDAACDAAEQSGKPVLLFQLLGNLDQEFC